MSTDAGPSSATGRGSRRRAVRFRRLVTITVTVLSLVLVGLTVANATQGPRLARAEVNPSALVSRPSETLVLRSHQRLQAVAASDVRVQPSTPVTVSSDDRAVTIRFDEMLPYAADYTVTVDAATAATGARSTLTYRFATPDATVFSLQRGGEGADDRILRRQVLGGDTTEVFAAPAIQEYAVVGNQLAVVTIEADGTNAIQMRPVDGGPASGIALPGPGTVTQVAASGPSNLLGYVFTPAGSTDASAARLIVYDAETGTGVGTEVLGLNEEPLPVLDWRFVPSSTSVVVQTSDLSLYVLDVVGTEPPFPFGQHQELRNFLPGTRILTVADANGATALDMDTGSKAPLPLPSDGSTEDDAAGDVIILGEDRYLEVLMTPEYAPGTTRLNPRIVAVDDRGPRVIYEPAAAGTDIAGMCISPNGRLVAVELLPAEREPDGYPNVPASTGMSTVLLDVDTGDPVGGMNGFLPSWC